MVILLIIFLIPVAISAQEVGESTFTAKLLILAEVLPPTTYQLILDKAVYSAVNKESKIIAINNLLNSKVYFKEVSGVDIDDKTGQDLVNYKYVLEEEISNKKLGRNYSAGMTYPVYKVEK